MRLRISLAATAHSDHISVGLFAATQFERKKLSSPVSKPKCTVVNDIWNGLCTVSNPSYSLEIENFAVFSRFFSAKSTTAIISRCILKGFSQKLVKVEVLPSSLKAYSPHLGLFNFSKQLFRYASLVCLIRRADLARFGLRAGRDVPHVS
jgi:hypothetical protein